MACTGQRKLDDALHRILFSREAIAEPRYGEDQNRMRWISLDLFAQAPDMYRYGFLTLILSVVAPDRAKQLLAAENLTAMLNEGHEQAKFGWRQMQRFASPHNLAASAIDHDVRRVEQITVSRCEFTISTPYLCPYPGTQLTQAKWFRYVIVRADFQPDHFIDLVAAGGQHHDGLAQPHAAHLPTKIEAAAIRQSHIQHDQLRLVIAGESDAAVTSRFPCHCITIACQGFLKARADRWIVFDD